MYTAALGASGSQLQMTPLFPIPILGVGILDTVNVMTRKILGRRGQQQGLAFFKIMVVKSCAIKT